MVDGIYFLVLATLVLEVNSQLCGCGCPGPLYPGPLQPEPLYPGPLLPPLLQTVSCSCPPIIPESCVPPLIPQIPAPQPIIAPTQPIIIAPPIIAQPYPNVVATTVVDNTLSNSLANALQLLIVSNLIENTLNAGVLPCNLMSLCDTVINPRPCVEPIIPNIAPPCLCEPPIFYQPPILEPIQPIFGPVPPPFVPFAPEVLFTPPIPPQLNCNCGYINNVPYLVNVEPLPCLEQSCNPIYNGYFY